jgi:hypothetical protein
MMYRMKQSEAGKSKDELLKDGYQPANEAEMHKDDSVMRQCTSCGQWFTKLRQASIDDWFCWACAYRHSTGKRPPPHRRR